MDEFEITPRDIWVTPKARRIIDSDANPRHTSMLIEDLDMALYRMSIHGIMTRDKEHQCVLRVMPPLPGSTRQRVVIWHFPTDGNHVSKEMMSRMTPYSLGLA